MRDRASQHRLLLFPDPQHLVGPYWCGTMFSVMTGARVCVVRCTVALWRCVMIEKARSGVRIAQGLKRAPDHPPNVGRLCEVNRCQTCCCVVKVGKRNPQNIHVHVVTAITECHTSIPTNARVH